MVSVVVAGQGWMKMLSGEWLGPCQASSARSSPTSEQNSRNANWRRHSDTDLTATPSACAAPAFDIPSAHARMIRARSTRQRSGSGRCAQCRTGARTLATAGLLPAPRRRWPRTTARLAVIVTHFGTRWVARDTPNGGGLATGGVCHGRGRRRRSPYHPRRCVTGVV